jgi:hypothetical protein
MRIDRAMLPILVAPPLKPEAPMRFYHLVGKRS